MPGDQLCIAAGPSAERNAAAARRLPFTEPSQQEVGPYVFQSLKVKTRVAWSGGGASVRWHEYRYFRRVLAARALRWQTA